jgi:hypothetical protein
MYVDDLTLSSDVLTKTQVSDGPLLCTVSTMCTSFNHDPPFVSSVQPWHVKDVFLNYAGFMSYRYQQYAFPQV